MMRTSCLLGLVGVLAWARIWAQAGDTATRRHDAPSQGAVSAQAQRATWRRAPVHWGKWAAAATAVTFTALGAHEHQNSNRVFSQLLDRCRANVADCTLGPDGSYLDPASEQLYQTSIHFDRRARLRLLLGQASLLASAGLFLADLRHNANGPDNIPYRGLKVTVEPRIDGARVGLRVMF